MNYNKNIKLVFSLMSFLFVGLMVYLTYFQIKISPELLSNPYNTRAIIEEEKVKRGNILDRSGNILVYSEKDPKDETYDIKYNDGRIFAPIIGYSSSKYGNTGIEAYYNRDLLGLRINKPIDILRMELIGKSKYGNNLLLTVDSKLQKTAYDSMGNNVGAVVVMNPKTGEILSMVSKPTFDPAIIDEDWKALNDPKSGHPLVNRATDGLYAPGSTFKIITATSALENISDIEKQIFNCKGYVMVNGFKLSDFQGESHGRVDIKDAFKYSCNSTFARIGLEVGADKLVKTADDFGINSPLNFDLSASESTLPKIKNEVELAESAIGQGRVLTTPLMMAMITSTIANNGVMMQPYIVQSIINPQGKIVSETSPKKYLNPVSEDISQKMKNMMISVVNEGTGTAAGISGVQVAGKTGTAQTSKGDNAWFVGFAPAENPTVAVAVIVENGKTGGSTAAPIAQKIFKTYFGK